MTKCPDECKKKWKMKQTKPGWQKQKKKRKERKREKKGKFRKLIVEEKMKIARMMEEEEKDVREDVDKKDLGSCYRSKKRICSEKREDISIVKNKERGSVGVCKESVEEEVYSTIEITTDITGVICAKERW